MKGQANDFNGNLSTHQERSGALHDPCAGYKLIAADTVFIKLLPQVDFLWAPKFNDLVKVLTTFHTSSHVGSRQKSYITFAGMWETESHVPSEYLETLDFIRQDAKIIIVVSVPRVYLALHASKAAFSVVG